MSADAKKERRRELNREYARRFRAWRNEEREHLVMGVEQRDRQIAFLCQSLSLATAEIDHLRQAVTWLYNELSERETEFLLSLGEREQEEQFIEMQLM